MKLYTITGDRKTWVNNLYGYEEISPVEYTDEAIAAFRKSVEGYILKDEYRWQDDDGDGGRGTYYHEIESEWLLISEGKVVGVCFLTKHYTHAMSSVYSYEKNAAYIDRANKRRGERWYDYCEIYENSTRDESTCRISIVPREEKPDYKSTKKLPVGNVVN